MVLVSARHESLDLASSAALERASGTWQADLPLGAFLPLDGPPVLVAEDLELMDVYTLTIITDLGLEFEHVELRRKQ